MKRITLLFLIIFAAFSTALAQTRVIVKSAQANVRSKPTSTAPVIGKLNNGIVVDATKINGNWIFISYKNLSGWMHASTLKMSDEEESEDYANEQESKWVEFGKSTSRIYLYNPSKMKKIRNISEIWIEQRDRSDDETIARILYQIDCSNNKMRSLAGVTYFDFTDYPNGETKRYKSSNSWDTPKSTFSIIIPDTMGESIAKIACK